MVVNELVTRFSFVGDLSPQGTFNDNLASSIGLLAGLGAALAASAGGFFAWASSVLESIDPLTDLSAETGVAVESIQTLGYAAEMSGSSSEAMNASFREVTKRLGEFVQTGGGPAKEIIEKLGLSMKDASGKVKTADVVITDLMKSMKGMSNAEKMNVLDKMGIDQSMLQTLSLSSEELAELVGQASAFGVVTKEQAESASAFMDSMGRLGFAMKAIQNVVAVGFAPAMTGLIDKFVDFIEVNADLIKGGLTWLGEVLTSTMGFMQRMAPIVLVLAGAFAVASLATGGFATIMGVVLSPVVLITGAIILLLLIVDDLITAFNGGQSVIADFFNEFLGIDIVPIMRGIVDAFMGMVDAVIGLISILWDAWTQFTTAIVKAFTGDWEGALESLLGAFNSLGEAVKMVFSGVFDFLFNAMGQVFGAIKSAAMSMLPDWAIKLMGGDASGVPGGAPLPSGSGQDALDVPMITPNDAMGIAAPGGQGTVNNSVEQQVQINVSSSDPKAAGAATADALQDQLKTAKTQVNRGGR